jgi:hypothetical protein
MAAKLTPEEEQIIVVYTMFDDDDVSTERLLSMVADECQRDVSDVAEALYKYNQKQ